MGSVGLGVMSIRSMTLDDVPAVYALECRIFPEPWSENVFREELGQVNRVYLVAEEQGAVSGYAGMMIVLEDAHVTTMAVSPEHRGGGLATRFMLRLIDAALEAGAQHLTLEVRMSNRAAQALYQKFGLAPVGVRKNYYLDEDALIMWASDIHDPEYADRLARIREEL